MKAWHSDFALAAPVHDAVERGVSVRQHVEHAGMPTQLAPAEDHAQLRVSSCSERLAQPFVQALGRGHLPTGDSDHQAHGVFRSRERERSQMRDRNRHRAERLSCVRTRDLVEVKPDTVATLDLALGAAYGHCCLPLVLRYRSFWSHWIQRATRVEDSRRSVRPT